jgi:hypothetical protein
LSEYECFLVRLFNQLNAGRRQRYEQEQTILRRLPERRIEACKKITVKVGPSSTIRVNHNVYSVDSRLIGERIQVRLYMQHLEIWYGQKKIDTLPRLRGEGRHAINYRHIIDSLVRKPGAFENYRYRDDLFPTTRFRIAYDRLKQGHVLSVAARQYLNILYLAARFSESAVDEALRLFIGNGAPITDQGVADMVTSDMAMPEVTQVHIDGVDLSCYDQLLEEVAS